MEQIDRTLYEVLADITGKTPAEVEKQIKQSQQKRVEFPSTKVAIISGSFPTYLPQIDG